MIVSASLETGAAYSGSANLRPNLLHLSNISFKLWSFCGPWPIDSMSNVSLFLGGRYDRVPIANLSGYLRVTPNDLQKGMP